MNQRGFVNILVIIGLMKGAIRDNAPIIFFENIWGYTNVKGAISGEVIPVGRVSHLDTPERSRHRLRMDLCHRTDVPYNLAPTFFVRHEPRGKMLPKDVFPGFHGHTATTVTEL